MTISKIKDDANTLKPITDVNVSNMRPPRANSPRQTRQKFTCTESLRQRCNDRNTDEIIRFVRDIQFERQPTLLRMQKKAPLPSIGQNCLKNGTSDSGFVDRGVDSADSDSEDILDNEVIYSQQKRTNPKLDPFFIDMLTCPRGTTNTSKDYAILSRSLPSGPCDRLNNNHRASRQNSFVKHGGKMSNRTDGNTSNHRNGKQLPPLSRNDFPERPSAPSPTRTPFMSDYSFIEEEPVEYLEL